MFTQDLCLYITANYRMFFILQTITILKFYEFNPVFFRSCHTWICFLLCMSFKVSAHLHFFLISYKPKNTTEYFLWTIKIPMMISFASLLLLKLTRRRHDIGNSLGDETSCESSTSLTYSTLNVLAPNGQWVLRKMPLKFYAHLIYY